MDYRARLARYLALIDEWGLCPWSPNSSPHIAITTPTSLLATIDAIPDLRIAMLILPAVSVADLRQLRDHVTAARPHLAAADFHPLGGDPTRADTPARLVPLLRRSPDPMLQLVPLTSLANLSPPPPSLATQAAMLSNQLTASTDMRARIAAANFATVHQRGLDTLLDALQQLARSVT
jgi:hypothetical protein